jgi:hypothetical protein
MRMTSLRVSRLVWAVVEYNGGPPGVDGTDSARTKEVVGTDSTGGSTTELDGTDSVSVASGGVVASRGSV